MAQNVVLYNLLISCPGDVQGEVKLIEDAVGEFNELYAEPLGITIQSRHWSKSSYAQSGGKPQALLNEQLVKKCDAAVAIFWTRFGSPTDEYGSGTEEEIEIMLQSGKQVFMYFSDKSIPPSQVNNKDYRRVQAFRGKYKDRGLYSTYSTDEEFKKLFFAQLSMYFLSDKKVKEITGERHSALKLLGIDKDGKLSGTASIYPFEPNSKPTAEKYMDSICAMYREIAGIDVGEQIQHSMAFSYTPFGHTVNIDETKKSLIVSFAEQFDIGCSDSFFDLGSLCSTSSLFCGLSGPDLNGSKDEIRKYKKINELYETIRAFQEWEPIDNAFSDMRCMKLAVQNCGNAIDEDIEIVLTISKSALLTVDEFPPLNNAEMGYLLRECEMDVLFGIGSTAEYIEYFESKKERHILRVSRHYERFIGTPDYSDDFLAELNSIFCYSIYPDGDNYILKLKVDYIKHNTSVAFPSVLFVKGEIAEIPYKITSKNNPDIVEGTLKICPAE